MISICNENTRNRIVSVKERGKKFQIINESSSLVNKVTVDGCYIKEGLKCDYLFEIIQKEAVEKVFYVELKGKDVEHGIKQLEATINHCRSEHQNSEKKCYIVASRYPKSSTSSQKLKSKFRRRNNGILLFIETQTKEITI